MLSGIDPIVLFFALGLLAGVMKADLRLPPAIYEFVSTLLLLAIGMKGGIERTFAVAVAFLATAGIAYEPTLPLLLVLLEIPAIILGILLARGIQAGTPWGEIAREVLLGKSVLLLLGGLLIGWAAGPVGLEPLAPLFFDLFKGILAIFLLEMGLIAADHLGGFRRYGLFMGAFALLIPPCFAMIGIGFAELMGLSLGGTILLATLAGSASYIAAPAAMRSAVPEANPALSLTAALAITFPFNILIGIPLYQRIATWLMEMPS